MENTNEVGTDKMKAVVLLAPEEYEVQIVDIPTPGPGEVLVKVKAIAICGSDPGLFAGRSRVSGWPPSYPFIAGHEFAGEIVEVGEGVTNFKVGDRVAGEGHCGCGICEMCKKGYYNLCLNYGNHEAGHHHYGFNKAGAYAQYQVYDVKALTDLPDNVTYEEGAMVDTAGTVYNALRLTGVAPGGYTVFIGPGPMGLIGMMMAKAMASKTIVIGRGQRLLTAKELGADYIINFEETEDVVAEVFDITGGVGADQVIEASGTNDAFEESVRMARKGGQVAIISIPGTEDHPIAVRSLVMNQISLHGVRANPNCSKPVLSMMEQGILDVKPLITQTFPIDEVHEAFDTFIHRIDGAIKVVIYPNEDLGLLGD